MPTPSSSPTPAVPRRERGVQTTMIAPASLLDRADAAAQARGVSRGALIRRALDEMLAGWEASGQVARATRAAMDGEAGTR